ncbi:hypothetical protein VTG60DRAFT_677 [Thermothelomyces hinnuleus]
MYDSSGMNGNGQTANGVTEGESVSSSPRLNIAVVGGGIVGCVTALGLLKRGISVKIYEQSRSFREIGAGVAFTANAQKCMELTNPDVLRAMKAVSTENPLAYYTYVDGYHALSDDLRDMREKELFRLPAGKSGFDGCHRAHFLEELVKFIPADVVEFRKRLDTYVVGKDDEPIKLKFEDGTSATADAVLLGQDNPASYPGFTRKVAFRGLVPMERAVEALGETKAHNQCMHMGPRGHVLNFPIAQHTLMNVVAFVTQDTWPQQDKLTAPATRQEVVDAFAEWNPAVRTIIGLLDESLDKWAIFDTYDHPAPTYADGRICIAGDAAHATSPHHGAGAGFGIEDALALATVLEQAIETLKRSSISKTAVLTAAFRAYDAARRERSTWLVRSSREVCETYEWNNPECGSDPGKCLNDIEWRAHKIWYFDIEGMIRDVTSAYQTAIQA